MAEDQSSIRTRLRAAAAVWEQTAAAHEVAAKDREDLVVQALLAGIRQADVASDIGKTREIVRRIARRRGIEGRAG